MVRAFYIRAVFTVPICVLSSLAFISYVNMFIALVEMNTVLINWRVEGSFSFHTASLYSITHLFWYICVYWSVLNAHFHLKSYFNYLWAVKIIILFQFCTKLSVHASSTSPDPLCLSLNCVCCTFTSVVLCVCITQHFSAIPPRPAVCWGHHMVKESSAKKKLRKVIIRVDIARVTLVR